MRISLIALTALSASLMYGDATTDLFAAIQAQDSKAVAQAVAAGAKVDSKRQSDGHTPKTYAYQQIVNAQHKPVPLFVSAASPLALAAAGLYYNAQCTMASIAAIISGTALSAYLDKSTDCTSSARNIAVKTHLDELLTHGGVAGLLINAWSSDRSILSAVGTAGLAVLYYQGYRLKVACEIYKLVDPQHVLIPELA